MFDFTQIYLIFGLLLAAYFFRTAVIAREFAMMAVSRYLKQLNLQLLDQNVALSAIWFKRNKQGEMRFWRSYQFEFSSMGDERYRGKVATLGREILSIDLEAYRVAENVDDLSASASHVHINNVSFHHAAPNRPDNSSSEHSNAENSGSKNSSSTNSHPKAPPESKCGPTIH